MGKVSAGAALDGTGVGTDTGNAPEGADAGAAALVTTQGATANGSPRKLAILL